MVLFSRSLWVWFGWSFLLASDAFALGFTAKGYESGKPGSSLLFTVDRTVMTDGLSSRTVFQSPEGKELAIESMQYDSSGQPVLYRVDHAQAGSWGQVEVKGKKLVFKYRSSDGKAKDREEDLPEIWAVGPMVIPLLKRHWQPLMAGEALGFRLASWERAETVGFKVFLEKKEKSSEGREVFIFKLKPSNFLISALVNPIRLEVRSDGEFLETMTGRTLPKREEKGKFRDLDATVVYSSK